MIWFLWVCLFGVGWFFYSWFVEDWIYVSLKVGIIIVLFVDEIWNGVRG